MSRESFLVVFSLSKSCSSRFPSPCVSLKLLSQYSRAFLARRPRLFHIYKPVQRPVDHRAWPITAMVPCSWHSVPVSVTAVLSYCCNQTPNRSSLKGRVYLGSQFKGTQSTMTVSVLLTCRLQSRETRKLNSLSPFPVLILSKSLVCGIVIPTFRRVTDIPRQ